MQYFSDGYRPGDPRIRPAAEGRGEEQGPLPAEVDVLIVGTGPAGLLLAAQLSQFPEIVTRVVEKADGPLQVGRADGVNCRTVEMFEAFGLADKMTAEAYWVNETHFWGADPQDNSRITRLGRTQDVRDMLSEFPHVIVNQARLLDYLLEFMGNSPSRLKVDYGVEAVQAEVPDAADEPVTVTLRRAEEEVTVRARYVAGCDGAHSVIRESIGRTMARQGADKAWGVLDLLAVTDFPDIRYKCTIQAGNGKSILLIPREGGHLFRLYVDVGEIAPDAWLTDEEVLTEARGVLAPYTLDVKEVAWFSVYRVGHGVTDKFDDVDDAREATRTPRVFVAGDACHTHTAKAGQGMNVSMADTFNLSWKLVAVLQGRSPARLLHTYNLERHGIAEDLIAMDKGWSKAIGAAQVDPSNPNAALIGLAEVQRQFITNLDFTAGMATHYDAGPLTGDNTYLDLAAGYEPGRRFHSAEVVRLSDAKRVHLGHDVHRADGRWRLYAFADAVDPRNRASRLNKLMDFLAGENSPVAKYTPTGWDVDSVFDVRAIMQQLHLELDWVEMHDFLRPRTGSLGLVDYGKVFCPVADVDQDIFDLRRIDRGSGALVVVRPDQYVALTLPMDGHDELDEFFARFMNPA